jgi:hypothetical protein
VSIAEKKKIHARLLRQRMVVVYCYAFLANRRISSFSFFGRRRPTCGRGSSRWVYAHWYEEGTWSGASGGIEPDGSDLDVEGQTRFLVNDDLKITEMVVTRTFSVWEKKLQEKG